MSRAPVAEQVPPAESGPEKEQEHRPNIFPSHIALGSGRGREKISAAGRTRGWLTRRVDRLIGRAPVTEEAQVRGLTGGSPTNRNAAVADTPAVRDVDGGAAQHAVGLGERCRSACDDPEDDGRPNVALAAVIVSAFVTPLLAIGLFVGGLGILLSAAMFLLAPPVIFATVLVVFVVLSGRSRK